jgi:CheY-like chemotaxis protein
MLAFARRQELKLAPTDISALLRGMQGFLQRSIGPNVRIEVQVAADLPTAATDPNQLETALLNLVLNARDAMSSAGVVTIAGRTATPGEGRPTLAPGDYVVVSVADTGQGMDAETLAKAAQPFFTTKDVGKGTGLGLSMVHGLAVQSGGGLVMESREGEGTTVEIWLPVSAEPIDAPEARIAARVAAGRQLVVLLVDDDSLVLSNTASLLEDFGHFVIDASSGAEALEAIKRHPDVDVVITDFAMPHMNGAELVRCIRRERPQTPLIVTTGYQDVGSRLDPDVLRLRKPFTQEQIQDALMQAVETARQTAP